MAKKLLFGTNLKMYKTVEETVNYLQELMRQRRTIDQKDAELFVIPSYTSLYCAVQCVDQDKIMLGAQNMYWEEQGQFTGEISPVMLKELGIRIVMIGHSERRHVFGERDEDIHKKVKSALEHGFTTLLCIGETAEEKECTAGMEVLRRQLKTAFYDVGDVYIPSIWVAYEPVWSIGVNGTPASPEYANEMQGEIKRCLEEIFGSLAEQIPVLYGGSVNPQNADKLIVQPNIDGLFTGRSAWNASSFGSLIRSAIKTYNDFIKKERNIKWQN